MPNDFVTLITTSVASEAEAVRLLLEREGIKAFIADANIVTAKLVPWARRRVREATGPRRSARGRGRWMSCVATPRSDRPSVRRRRAPRHFASPAAPPCPRMPIDAPNAAGLFKLRIHRISKTNPKQTCPRSVITTTVPYEPDIHAALDKASAKSVFESKDFNGTEFDPPSPEGLPSI